VVAVGDAESFAMTRRLAREEGLLVGGSSGMAVVAALHAAHGLPPEAVVVVLLPDSGRGYLGKIFDDAWLRSYGFGALPEARTVRDVVTAKQGSLPALVHAHPSDTVRDAVAMMTEFGVSQLPVLTAEPPVVIGEVVGAVDEESLLELVFSGGAQMSDAIATVMQRGLPQIGANESVPRAREALTTSGALLVVDEGAPVAVLTRADLLTYLSH
jgi:cystathionine beta-synthase